VINNFLSILMNKHHCMFENHPTERVGLIYYLRRTIMTNQFTTYHTRIIYIMPTNNNKSKRERERENVITCCRYIYIRLSITSIHPQTHTIFTTTGREERERERSQDTKYGKSIVQGHIDVRSISTL
jgi:hypothetical protein